jgi:hypothetical protein
MPSKTLVGKNSTREAITDDVRMSEIFACKNISKKSLNKKVIKTKTADKKIIKDNLLKLGLLSAILPPK